MTSKNRFAFLKNSRICILVFLCLATLQFGVYITNFGPLTGPDPEMSIAGSYSLATGQCFTSTEDKDQEIAGNNASSHVQKIKLPENLAFDEDAYHKDLVTTLLTSQISQAPGTYTIPSDEKLSLQRNKLSDDKSSTNMVESYTRANQYTPLSYVSTAIGMKIAMLANANSWGLLFGARLSNFILFAILAILAIIVAPKAKALFVAIASLPPAIFCASSMSVDALLVGVSLFYVAFALKVVYDRKQLSILKMLVIAILTFAILILKAPYAPLALIYLALPRNIWPTKAKVVTSFLTLVAFFCIYGWWATNFQMVYTIPTIDYAEQMSSVLSNLPKSILICLANAIFYLAITVPTSLLYMAIPILATFIIISRRGDSFATSKVVLVVAIALITTTLIYFFLMLTWNELGSGLQNLSGFQERYLLPMLPVLALLVPDKESTQPTF